MIFISLPTFAQDGERDEHREKIKALKVAYFTQELNFDEKTAEKFWPVYNKYEKKRRELHSREHIELKNVECISEDEAEDLISEFLDVESEEYRIKKQLFKDLKHFMTAREIIKLHKLESEFHKKLIKKYHSKREEKQNSSSK